MSLSKSQIKYLPTSLENRVIQALLGILVLTILGCILVLQPIWGPMDDVQHVYKTLPDIEKNGLWLASWNYAVQDLGWGMFRPLYPIMVFLLYKPAQLSEPWVLFLINGLLTFGLLYFLAVLLERLISVHRVFLLLIFCTYFYLYDLFLYPSLQEKLVHGLGGILLWLCLKPRKSVRNWTLIYFVFILALGSKASILIYYTMGVWILFSLRPHETFPRKILASLPLAIPLMGALVFFAYISSGGGYTAGNFTIHKILPNLLSFAGLLLFLVAIFSALLLISDLRKKSAALLCYTPVVGVLAFLVLFLPWGIATYIQTMVGPFFCATIIFLAARLIRWEYRWIWVIPSLALALLIGIYRPVTMFIRLSDMGQFLSIAPELSKKGVREITVPCMEGADSLQTLLKEIAKVSITVIRKEGALPPPIELNGKWIFFDQSLCPLPNKSLSPEGCIAHETLFMGRIPKSYRLVKLGCG